MATTIQIVFDAADPHAQVRFWAAALGYQVEDHGEVVDRLIASGHLPDGDVVEIDGTRTFRDVATAIDPAGVGPRLFLQRVPELKSTKNRVHLDLHVGPVKAAGEIDRLISLGATVAWTTEDKGPVTTTMRDPEGNEFCLS